MSLICSSMHESEGKTDSGESRVRLRAFLVECRKAAQSCEEHLACTRPSEDEKTVCDSSEALSKCYGNLVIPCQQGTRYDCQQAGLTCVEMELPEVEAICSAGSCDSEGEGSVCDGDLIRRCWQDQVFEVEDCRAMGGICGINQEGHSGCMGTGETCEFGYWPSCDGTIKDFCLGGKVARLDCAEKYEGGVCYGLMGTEEECMLGKDCYAYPGMEDEEECSDGIITFCLSGRRTELDCRKYGFSGCETVPGMSGQPYAYCTP